MFNLTPLKCKILCKIFNLKNKTERNPNTRQLLIDLKVSNKTMIAQNNPTIYRSEVQNLKLNSTSKKYYKK
jgi:hypothetical protein